MANPPTRKPLFVPLKTEWFEAFRRGTKRTEWRAYGPRWNHGVATRGRPITLSCGYSGARLRGRILWTRRVAAARAPRAAREIYPDATHFCAIHIAIAGD